MTPDEARAALASFLDATPRDARVLVFHDFDADGVTAAIVLQRTLERSGFTNVRRLPTMRERDAWSHANRARIAEARPHTLFVLDLGSRDEPLVDGTRCCIIDHHHPDGTPPGALRFRLRLDRRLLHRFAGFGPAAA